MEFTRDGGVNHGFGEHIRKTPETYLPDDARTQISTFGKVRPRSSRTRVHSNNLILFFSLQME